MIKVLIAILLIGIATFLLIQRWLEVRKQEKIAVSKATSHEKISG